MRRAREAATRAIQLDEALAEGHNSLAGIKFSFDWDWKGAEAEFRRAIELNPSDVTAHFWYAQLLLALGRWDESLENSSQASHLDPVAPIFLGFRGAIFHNERRYGKAIEQLQKALTLFADCCALGDSTNRCGAAGACTGCAMFESANGPAIGACAIAGGATGIASPPVDDIPCQADIGCLARPSRATCRKALPILANRARLLVLSVSALERAEASLDLSDSR
jgi:Flp pilus assembly protein TadD